MGLVLVGSVGFNPSSVLVVARTFPITRAVLLCTAQTLPVAERLAAQLGVPSRLSVWERVGGIDAIAAGIGGDVDLAEDEVALVDITGALKPMAIGTWLGLAAQLGDRLRGVYLDPTGAVCNARSGAALPSSAVLEADEFLAWKGAAVGACAWRGPLSDLPPVFEERRWLAEALMQRMAAGGRLGTDPLRDAVRWSRAPRRPLPTGFRFADGMLHGPGDGFLGAHGWLEELALLLARDACEGAHDVRAALNLHVRGEREGQDEMDVLLTRGSRVVVIEAKARANRNGAGTDVLKRARKAERFFTGASTRILFLHPAWGDTSGSPALADVVGRNVRLLGAGQAELVDAVRDGLGLRGA